VSHGNEWLFAYGSVIFRPSFPFADRRITTLEGWARRFHQGSEDHRGVPGAPGRVVTLIESPGARCVGVAYRIAKDDATTVWAELDHREKGGYAPITVGLVEGIRATTYVAARGNPHWLGDAPLDVIAEQIARSRGPSGRNADYLLELAKALRTIGAVDEHVFALEQLVIAAVADDVTP
jgi:glutathione-specific gamma-glutamylcyclotransferase